MCSNWAWYWLAFGEKNKAPRLYEAGAGGPRIWDKLRLNNETLTNEIKYGLI